MVSNSELLMMNYELERDLSNFSSDTTKIGMAYQSLENTLNMYDYVKQYGINRTFLSLYNSNGELNNLTGVQFPACESMGSVGNPNGRVSRAFIAAMEDEQGGVIDAVVKFAKTVWAKIKAFFTKIWAKVKDFFRASNQKEATLLQRLGNSKLGTAAKCVVKVFTNKGVLITAFGLIGAWATKKLVDYLKQKAKELGVGMARAAGRMAWNGIKNGVGAVFGRKNANQQQQQPQQQQPQQQPQQQQQQQTDVPQPPQMPQPEIKEVPVTGDNIKKAAAENHEVSVGADNATSGIDTALNVANTIADSVLNSPACPPQVAEAGKVVMTVANTAGNWLRGVKKHVIDNVNSMDKATAGNQQQKNGWKEEGEPELTNTQKNQNKTPQEFTGNYQYKGPQ